MRIGYDRTGAIEDANPEQIATIFSVGPREI
jgi:hypothetical protein